MSFMNQVTIGKVNQISKQVSDNASSLASSLQHQTGWINITQAPYNADPTGVNDSSSAIQSVLNNGLVPYAPKGTYKLSNPIKVKNGFTIFGDPVDFLGSGTVFKPTTVAITVDDTQVTNQLQSALIENIQFVGGTTHIDLPLFHMVRIRNCIFTDFSKCGIVMGRGEKHELHSLFFYSNTVSGDKCISFTNVTNDSMWSSTMSTYNFGSPGQWIDRISMKDLHFQRGTNNNYNYAVYCGNTLSNVDASNWHIHGTVVCSVYIVTLQTSHFHTMLFDAVGTVGSPVTDIIYIGTTLNCTFNNVNPGFSGNQVCTNEFHIGYATGSVAIGCNVSLNGTSTHGFRLGNNANQGITFIGCVGDLYLESTNTLQQKQVNVIGCAFSSATVPANLFIPNNQPLSFNFMADGNGASASNIEVDFLRATGQGGGYETNIQLKQNYLKLGNGQFYTGTGTPLNTVYTAQGSMFVRTDGGVGSTAYLKESGIYNTATPWNPIQTIVSGTTAQRPSTTGLPVGFGYFDTSLNGGLGMEIRWSGVNWVNPSTGATV